MPITSSVIGSPGPIYAALVLGSGSSVPDGDGAGEDGRDDGSVGVQHHCVWPVELLQLPQEVHPLGDDGGRAGL